MKRIENSRLVNSVSALILTVEILKAAGKWFNKPMSAMPSSEVRSSFEDSAIRASQTESPRWSNYDPIKVALTVLILTGFPLYAQKGMVGVLLAPFAGAIGWFIAGHAAGIKSRAAKATITISWALLGGLTVDFKFYASQFSGDKFAWYSLMPGTTILGCALGVMSGFALRLAPSTSREPAVDGKTPSVGKKYLKVAVVFGISLGLVRLLDVVPVNMFLRSLDTAQQLQQAIVVTATTILTAAVSIWFCLWGGWYAGVVLEPVLAVYDQVWIFLGEIVSAVAGFVIVYSLVVVLFAAQFWAAWRLNPHGFYRFDQTIRLNFWDFLYFSLLTATAAGAGDVPPPNNLVLRALMSLELLAGVLLATLLLSAIMSVVRKQRAEMD